MVFHKTAKGYFGRGRPLALLDHVNISSGNVFSGDGLVRDYFPEGADFKKITKQQVQEVEDTLNKRPRKRYNWKNPFKQRAHVLGIS